MVAENTSMSEKIKAKQRYENEKRTSRPISFNRESHASILELSKKFEFGTWVKNILSAFSSAEVSLVKEDLNFVPSALVEHAIENGYFDLDEYLASKGKSIVDTISLTKTPSNHAVAVHDEYNQEYYT